MIAGVGVDGAYTRRFRYCSSRCRCHCLKYCQCHYVCECGAADFGPPCVPGSVNEQRCSLQAPHFITAGANQYAAVHVITIRGILLPYNYIPVPVGHSRYQVCFNGSISSVYHMYLVPVASMSGKQE